MLQVVDTMKSNWEVSIRSPFVLITAANSSTGISISGPYHEGVILDFSRLGKPTDNNYIESFNRKFQAECLNAHWFMRLDDALAKMEDWCTDYNPVS